MVTVRAIEGVAFVLSFPLSKKRHSLLLLQPWARSLRPGDLFPVEMNSFQTLCCSVTEVVDIKGGGILIELLNCSVNTWRVLRDRGTRYW